MPTRDDALPGTPCWLDLGTSDKAKSKAFYGELFGWTAEDNDEFGGYTSFSVDGGTIAGGMQNDGQMGPDGWSAYFCTDDIAKAVSLGGSVVQPAEDTPYGRLATLTDITGATFKLVQPPAEA
jgi:predicted enzyme related to lactoylglutathione lyase